MNVQLGIGEILTLKNVDIFPPFQTQHPNLVSFENEMQINPIWQESAQKSWKLSFSYKSSDKNILASQKLCNSKIRGKII